MQQNISTYERLAAVTMGSYALTRGLSKHTSGGKNWREVFSGLGLLWRGVSGYCPLYQALENRSSASAHMQAEKIARTIVVDRPIDYVREILGEDDPEWLASSSKKTQIRLGEYLWDVRLSEVHGRNYTLVTASLAENEIKKHTLQFLFKNQAAKLKEKLDANLRRFKSAIESDPLFAIEA